MHQRDEVRCDEVIKMSEVARSGNDGPKGELKPLKITCTSSDCGNGLHCFRRTRKMIKANQGGACRSCGATLIDWKRVRARDLGDAVYTFEALKYELIRHHFWHKEIDEKAVMHARRKGRVLLREAAENRLRKYIGPAEPPFDGRQTPMRENTIFYAQHATATCCRKCLQEWYDIPMGVALTDEQISYFTELVVRYITERLPDLKEEPEQIPRRATKASRKESATTKPRAGSGEARR
jgi:hypothetical protein